MIKNIVFDMGNVILRYDPEYFMTRAGVTDTEDRRIIRNGLFDSWEWAMMDRGMMNEQDGFSSVMKRIPENLRDVTGLLMFHWADARETVPGMEELVQKIKNAGYHLYLLSNASFLQHTYWPKVPVSRLFDGEVISCDIRAVKPMPEIYKALTEKYGLIESECVFIDDSASNVAGAIACGWEGIVFHQNAEETEAELKKMGVTI